MTLDDFLTITETRIPRVSEMIALCDTLKIRFSVGPDGTPLLKANRADENTAEAVVLAKLFKREPFRSMVIKERIPTLLLKYADGAVFSADETDRGNPTHFNSGRGWEPVPSVDVTKEV